MKLVELATYFVYISTYLIAVPVVFGAYVYRHLPGVLRILLAGLTAVLILDVLLLFSLTAKNFFLYLFSAVDLIMYSLVFAMSAVSIHTRNLILAGGTLVVLIVLLDALFYSGINTNGVSNAITKLYLVLLSVYTLSRLIQDVTIESLTEQPLLWIGLGVLLYSLVGLVDAFSKSMLSFSQNLYLQFYIVWSIVGMIMYGCFTYAFKMGKHQAMTG